MWPSTVATWPQALCSGIILHFERARCSRLYRISIFPLVIPHRWLACSLMGAVRSSALRLGLGPRTPVAPLHATLQVPPTCVVWCAMQRAPPGAGSTTTRGSSSCARRPICLTRPSQCGAWCCAGCSRCHTSCAATCSTTSPAATRSSTCSPSTRRASFCC